MAGDRNGYRSFYPDILNMTEFDRQNQIRDIHLQGSSNTHEVEEYINNLYSDVLVIRAGVTQSVLDWPPNILSGIKNINFDMCMERIVSGSLILDEAYSYAISQLGREKTDLLRANYTKDTIDDWKFLIKQFPDKWTEYFLDFPIQRIEESNNWKKPFEAMSPVPTYPMLDVPDYLLDPMHNYIVRAHPQPLISIKHKTSRAFY